MKGSAPEKLRQRRPPIFHRCGAHEAGEQCAALRPAWLCTRPDEHGQPLIERRCGACRHEASCCRLAAEVVRGVAS